MCLKSKFGQLEDGGKTPIVCKKEELCTLCRKAGRLTLEAV